MNKLIERLSSATHRFGNESQEQATIRRNQAIQDAIKALKAADAAVNELEMSGDPNNPYAVAYRNLTQETPHDVH